MKVLMVCLGNICRSPMAEGVLHKKAQERGLDIEIDSAGTIGYHAGNLPDPRGIATMKKMGTDITNQRSRQITTRDLSYFDHVLVMDQSNYEDVIDLCTSKEQVQKVKQILNYSHPNQNLPVPDPYYGGDSGFDNVYQLLEEACDAFLDTHF